jgi:hypothetical protein
MPNIVDPRDPAWLAAQGARTILLAALRGPGAEDTCHATTNRETVHFGLSAVMRS